MSKRKWKLKAKVQQKGKNQVWLVEDQQEREGYFKFTSKKRWKKYRLLLANEFIAMVLAKKVGLPVAKVMEAKIKDRSGKERKGIISLMVPVSEVITWRMVDPSIKDNPKSYINQYELLSQVHVFDTWILNTDRAAGNLILYRNVPTEKYSWYLIDHGTSPLTCYRNVKEFTVYSHNNDFIKVPKRMENVFTSAKANEEMISKIELISESDIEMALQSVPKNFLRTREKKVLKEILLYRQEKLRQLITPFNNL